MDTKTKKSWTKTKINLLVDALLLVAFLVDIEAHATGIPVHEWLGVALFVGILVHILIHWDWIIGITKRFFKKLKAEPRINYFVDLGVFIGFTTIICSGLVISKNVLPAIGLNGSESAFWKQLHFISTDLTIFLSALHLALHWRWIKSAVTRYLLHPGIRFFKKEPLQMVPVEIPIRDQD